MEDIEDDFISEEELRNENESRLTLKDEVEEWRSVDSYSIKQIKQTKIRKYGYCTLFRFATKCHKFLLVLGIIASIASATCLPILVTFFGKLSNKMVLVDLVETEKEAYAHNISESLCFQSTGENFSQIADKDIYKNPHKVVMVAVKEFAIWHTVVALIFMFLSGVYFICWYVPAEYMMISIRRAYFKSLLRMDFSKWFDSRKGTDFGSQLVEQHIREGIGQQIPIAIDLIFMFIFSCVNAFYRGWALTLIALISIPMFILTTFLVAQADAARTLADQKAFSGCSTLAEEVITNVRTVMVYNGQKNELRRFKQELSLSSKGIFKRCLVMAICNCLIWFLTYGNYALTFYFGANWVLRDRRCSDVPQVDWNFYDPEDLIIIFFSIMFGASNIALALPTIQSIKIAKSIGKEIFQVIDTVPEIDCLSKDGIVNKKRAKGRLEFTDVVFSYSTRPNWFVLNGFNAKVKENTTSVLVGVQGSGKSTILKLILKQYLPHSGSVKLDGIDLKELNTQYLRSQIGVVSHAPKLFNTTIEENVRFGKLTATKKEIIDACIAADAHDFIMELKDGYNTIVGVQGDRLSLSQRIRIAIAIVILKNPAILILDSPTSSLDEESEANIQRVLESIRESRTTFILDHRLVSISKADMIFVVERGQITEQGTYTDLMARKGLFYRMVSKQDEAYMKEHKYIDAYDDHEEIMSRRRQTSRKDEALRHTRHALRYRGRTFSRKNFISNEPYHFNLHQKEAKKLQNNQSKFEGGDGVSENKEEPEHDKLEATLPVSTSEESLDVDWMNRKKIELAELKYEQENPHKLQQKHKREFTFYNGIKISSSKSIALIFLGTVGSILVGAVLPVYGIVFGEIIGALSVIDMEESKKTVTILTLAFIGIGTLASLATFIQGLTLTVASYKTVMKIRKLIFISILRQDMTWFEHPDNTVSSLTNRLSSDAANIEGIILSMYGTFVQCLTTIVVSIAFSFFESIRLTVYCVALTPLVIAFTLIDGLITKIHEDKKAAATDNLLSLVTEVFQNRENVRIHQLEQYYLHKFDACIRDSMKSFWSRTMVRTVAFGLAQGGGFCLYSLCVYAGGVVMNDQGLPYDKVLKVGDAMILGIFTIGSQLTVFPSFVHAIESSKLLIRIINHTPSIKYDVGGETIQKLDGGSISFQDVEFSYPLQPEVNVLQGLNMDIDPGKMYAIVGASGSGKSTILQLLLRFHDATHGTIEFFGRDIKSLNCASLRRTLAVLSQEPRLFDRTIEDNITLGKESRLVYMEDVIEAAVKANIHDFIVSLPEGYKTRVGSLGSRLTQSQKQKIAIARALYTKSPVILLDDPTSGLDLESEKQFQETIEVVRAGKTFIMIAQRIRSIKQADVIFVLDRGVVVEKGSHAQLLTQNGIYAKIHKTQNNAKVYI